MNTKQKIITLGITILTMIAMIVVGFQSHLKDTSKEVYQVYLDGQSLGLIEDQDELLNMINEEQTDIKNYYHVDGVYPPNGFEIVKYKTYDDDITSASNIYNIVKEKGDFTIKGYTITITTKKTEEEEEKQTHIYVLDQNVFKEALETLITVFVDEEDYQNYINNTQEEITTVGTLIEHMYFEETITIRESNISVNEKIYTDPNELGKYLLFGKTETSNNYTVKKGDTIQSIAEENKLNAREFLLANPQFKREDSLLAIGEEVSVDLINPVLTLVQELHVVEDTEQIYEKKEEVDNSKPSSYSEVTQAGVTGIVRTTQEVKTTNGERNQGAIVISSVTIRDVVDEITTVGKKYKPQSPSGHYEDNGKEFGWPTNRPYVITTNYEWRWGSFHYGLDISGTGFGSPIYASKAGTVVDVNTSCANIGYYGSRCGAGYGNYVIIRHDNNIYTLYGHMTQDIYVSVGQTVSRGQTIGTMGSSGSSDGTHVHFSASYGLPNAAGFSWFSPWSLFQ